MRRGFKPYSKRKPFKRKSGGAKFMLNGRQRKDVSFDTSSLDKNALAGILNLIRSILGQKRVRSNIKTGDR